MKKPHEKFLDSVKDTLLLPFEEGILPEDVKQTVIYLLSPYFRNSEILNELAGGILVTEAVNLARINNDSWAKDMFAKVLSSYQTAYNLDKQTCITGCVESEERILRASSEFASMFNLGNTLTELADLSIEDFSYVVFRNLGALIEACFQPYLKELLLQIRICHGKPNSEQGLEKMTLGSVVKELYDTSNYGELFAPAPWHIKLHQWRNIAQHHNTRIEKDRITATYDVSGGKQSVSLTREELLSVLKQINLVFSVVRGVRSIFVIDNIEEFRVYSNKSVSIRTDIKVFQFASSLATQGFELNDISFEEESVIAVIKDVTDTPSTEEVKAYKLKRMIHSTQFVYAVWFYFPAKTITIKHLDRQDNLKYLFSGRGSDCEEISNEELPLEELFKRLIFCNIAQSSNV